MLIPLELNFSFFPQNEIRVELCTKSARNSNCQVTLSVRHPSPPWQLDAFEVNTIFLTWTERSKLQKTILKKLLKHSIHKLPL